MSNNNPHDNIYSILGKLDALKPTPQEKHESLVKEIRESVEAKGSVLAGVDAVQAKLARQFAESMDEKAPPGAKAERMVKHIKTGYAKDGKLTDKEKAIAYATTWAAHNKGQVEEAGTVCSECGMTEGECEHTMAEGETTHKGGEKVSTTKGTLHKSKATVDTEKELSRGDVPDLDADDEPKVSAEKKGRGRPKMATKDRSQASMPWGGNPPKDKWKAAPGSRVHRMSDKAPKGSPEYAGESMEDSMKRLEKRLTESRLLDDTGQTLDHVLNRFRAEVRNFEQGGDLDEDLYHALFDYYNDAGEMPYGVAKARDGDPMEWVAQNLESHLRGGGVVGGNPDEDYGMEREGIEGNMPPVDNIPGKEDLLRGKGRSYYEEEVTMEDELNELARLAGIQTSEGNAFTGKLAKTPKGGEFELDGKTFKDTSALGETEVEEADESPKADKDYDQDGEIESGKDEVIGSRRKAAGLDESTTFDECGASPEGDFNINTSMSGNGDKSVTVTATGDQAAELLQMLRIAGLGAGAKAQELEVQPDAEVIAIDANPEVVADEGMEVSQPIEPVNNPKPEYKTMRQSTMNPGEGDFGEKAMHPDRPTKNNGDNALARPANEDVLTLEAKLAAEYESIKKVNK